MECKLSLWKPLDLTPNFCNREFLFFIPHQNIFLYGTQSNAACGKADCCSRSGAWWNSQFFFIYFCFFRSKIDFLALFLGKRGPPCENIGRDLHFAPVVGPFWSREKNLKNRDLEFPNFRTLTRLTEFIWPLPEALAWAKPSHRTIF